MPTEVDVQVHPESQIGEARRRRDEAEQWYNEAIAPARHVAEQAAELRQQLPDLERQAADLRSPIDAEIRLTATKQRLERLEAEHQRMVEKATPMQQRYEREQANVAELEHQYEYE